MNSKLLLSTTTSVPFFVNILYVQYNIQVNIKLLSYHTSNLTSYTHVIIETYMNINNNYAIESD